MVVSNLSVLLKERGLTIGEVTEKTGISRNTVSYLVNNKTNGIRFETLDYLCNLLDITVNELLIKSEYNIHTAVEPAEHGINLLLSATHGTEKTDEITITGRTETVNEATNITLSWDKPPEPETAKEQAVRALQVYESFPPVMRNVIKRQITDEISNHLGTDELITEWNFIRDMKEYLLRLSVAESLLSDQ